MSASLCSSRSRKPSTWAPRMNLMMSLPSSALPASRSLKSALLSPSFVVTLSSVNGTLVSIPVELFRAVHTLRSSKSMPFNFSPASHLASPSSKSGLSLASNASRKPFQPTGWNDARKMRSSVPLTLETATVVPEDTEVEISLIASLSDSLRPSRSRAL